MAKEITNDDLDRPGGARPLVDSHGRPIEPGPSPEEREGFFAVPDDGRQHVFDHPSNVQKIIRIFLVACGIILAIDGAMFLHMYANRDHPHDDGHVSPFTLETAPFFYPIYGFVACVILVLAAKQLRKVIMRPEDYYDS